MPEDWIELRDRFISGETFAMTRLITRNYVPLNHGFDTYMHFNILVFDDGDGGEFYLFLLPDRSRHLTRDLNHETYIDLGLVEGADVVTADGPK